MQRLIDLVFESPIGHLVEVTLLKLKKHGDPAGDKRLSLLDVELDRQVIDPIAKVPEAVEILETLRFQHYPDDVLETFECCVEPHALEGAMAKRLPRRGIHILEEEAPVFLLQDPLKQQLQG